MQRLLRFHYNNDTLDVLNVLAFLIEALVEFGVTMEVLEGGDGFEEILLTKRAEGAQP